MKPISINLATLTDTTGQPVNIHDYAGVSDNSKTIKANQIFVAVRGVKHDGHDHIDQAILSGAAVVIVDEQWMQQASNDASVAAPVRIVIVTDTKATLAAIASQLYPIPANIVAVTGTNGKTSTTFFVQQMLTLLGIKAASIGTLGVVECNKLPDESKAASSSGPSSGVASSSSLTTPGTLQMYQLLGRLKQSGIEYVVIEASSHGLEQGRLNHIPFRGAAFTSFTQDHLDYHGTMEEYLNVKLYLFDQLLLTGSFAIIDSDMSDASTNVTDRVLKVCETKRLRTLTYGSRGSFIKVLSIKYTPAHMVVEFSLRGGEPHQFHCRLLGAFQAYNILCALGIVLELGFDEARCLLLLEHLTGVPGRMERVEVGRSASHHVYVDYAHTPDGLRASLSSMRAHMNELARAGGAAATGKLIVVFGCGGDRDKDKRPKMGQVCAELADIVIVTDDNPRTEDPTQIRREILAGCSTTKCLPTSQHMTGLGANVSQKSTVLPTVLLVADLGAPPSVIASPLGGEAIQHGGSLECLQGHTSQRLLTVIEIPGREQAIRYAIQQAATNPSTDFILIAGKGCERFQLVGNQQLEFDDRLVAAKWVAGGESQIDKLGSDRR